MVNKLFAKKFRLSVSESSVGKSSDGGRMPEACLLRQVPEAAKIGNSEVAYKVTVIYMKCGAH